MWTYRYDPGSHDWIAQLVTAKLTEVRHFSCKAHAVLFCDRQNEARKDKNLAGLSDYLAGPAQKWSHWFSPTTDKTLCGEDIFSAINYPDARPCPDCERVRVQMFPESSK
jgi:hypothetical protein